MIEKKNYFTIEEVSRITGVAKYTLRYWEKKFSLIKPVRLPSKHRRYTRLDLENIERIKKLLEEGYSLNGIKKVLYSKKNKTPINLSEESDRYKKILTQINQEIKEIIKHI